MSRAYPKVVVRRSVRNQSARTGVPQLIVIHSTESDNRPGSGDLAAIGAWFDNAAAQASSHVCVDADGTSARFVSDERKAWHCAGYNSVSLGVEQIGRASQQSWTRDEIRETARWVAYWSRQHHIPIRRGQVAGGRVIRSGVVTHADLGMAGGGHHDPGGGYPLQGLLNLAKFYRGKQR